jgi:hypothetical protein
VAGPPTVNPTHDPYLPFFLLKPERPLLSLSLSFYSPSSQIPLIWRDFSMDFDLPPFLKVFSMATLDFVQLKS